MHKHNILHSIQDNIFKISFISLLFFLAISCKKNNMAEIAAIVPSNDHSPLETSRNVEFIITDSAVVRAKLITPLMQTFYAEEPYVEMPEGLNVIFYDSKTIPSGYLSANYGKRYSIKRIIEVKDNVVVVNTQHDTFTTEFLTWNERQNKVYTDHYVRVKTKDEIITGKGFSSDMSFTNYEFRNIKGIISLSNSK
jgi:LPS export ABC transporter protein LptC